MNADILFDAIGGIDDSFILSAAYVVEPASQTAQQRHKRKLFRTVLIAALITAFFATAAFAIGYTIHQQRQSKLKESLKIEENNVSGYMEYAPPLARCRRKPFASSSRHRDKAYFIN